MKEIIEKPDGGELREEFRQAKLWRDTQRELRNIGRIFSLEEIQEVVEVYQKLADKQIPDEDEREIVIDGDMVRSKFTK